jgi:hypothetical protein
MLSPTGAARRHGLSSPNPAAKDCIREALILSELALIFGIGTAVLFGFETLSNSRKNRARNPSGIRPIKLSRL